MSTTPAFTPPTPATVAATKQRLSAKVADSTPVDQNRVVKTKNLRPGSKVRHFLNGQVVGLERQVGTCTKIDDGFEWAVTWASGQPDATYKAAYRWYLTEAPEPAKAAKRKPARQRNREPYTTGADVDLALESRLSCETAEALRQVTAA